MHVLAHRANKVVPLFIIVQRLLGERMLMLALLLFMVAWVFNVDLESFLFQILIVLLAAIACVSTNIIRQFQPGIV